MTPTDMICTKQSPCPTVDSRQRWLHPDAQSVGEEYNGLSGGGDYERYKCPHCGRTFYVELPD